MESASFAGCILILLSCQKLFLPSRKACWITDPDPPHTSLEKLLGFG